MRNLEQESSSSFEQQSYDIFQKLSIYDKYIENPTEMQGSFFEQFFRDYQISKIHITKQLLTIQLVRRRNKNRKANKQKKQSNVDSLQSQSQPNFLQIKNSIEDTAEKIKNIPKNVFTDYGRQQFDKFVKSKCKNQIFWASFITPTKQFFASKNLVFSRKMIQMLGYQMEQAALYFRRYRQMAFNYISNKAYQKIILGFIQNLKDLGGLSQQQYKDKSKINQIFKKNATIFDNQMIGKDNLRVMTQIRFEFINPSTLYFEIQKIKNKEKFQKAQNFRRRQVLQDQFHKRIYHSLSSIYKLPKSINPHNQQKVCSYRQINLKNDKKQC